MKKISVAMIVKNEERCLDRCLKSLHPSWEKIVVDTGSTDRTIEIAKENGAKVFHFDWINDFSAARNYSLSQARGRWILMLDADEWLDEADRVGINQLIQRQDICGFQFRQVQQADGQEVSIPTFRLYHNHPSIRYQFSAHEQIVYSLDKYAKARGYILGDSPDVKIYHDGYDGDRGMMKIRRAVPILEKAVKEDPEVIYLWSKLAECYTLLKDHENKLRTFEVISRLVKEQPNVKLEALTKACLDEYEKLKANNFKGVSTGSNDAELLDAGIKILEERALADPNNMEIWMKLVECYGIANRREDRMKAIQRVIEASQFPLEQAA